jgi:antitoxin CptB
MDEKKLESYTLILDQNDNDLYTWITKKSSIPSNLDTEIINKLSEIAKI